MPANLEHSAASIITAALPGVNIAPRRWQQEEQDIIDDCTALVLHVTPQPMHTHSGSGSSAGSSASSALVSGAGAGAGAIGGAAPKSSPSGVAALAGRLEAGLRLGNGQRATAPAPAGGLGAPRCAAAGGIGTTHSKAGALNQIRRGSS
jgi:hypothetical protein